MRLKVLFDVSMLAGGPHNRTGIGRVVSCLAAELARSSKCETRFCTAGSPQLEAGVSGELSRPPFSTGSFVRAPLGNARLYRAAANIAGRLATNDTKAGRGRAVLAFPFRAARKIMERRASPLPASALQWADVFHSPAPPLSGRQFWRRLVEGGPFTRPERTPKLFVTVHDMIAVRHPEWFDNSMAKRVRAALDSLTPDIRVLCVSEATRRDLLEYRPDLDPRRVVVTHLAASADFSPCRDAAVLARVRSEYHIPGDVPYFLTLNTLEPRKNLAAVVQAFHDLVEQQGLTDLHLVMAGGQGWKFDGIMKLIEARPALRSRIVLTGFVKDPDLPVLYSGAMAFIYPSLYEGFGLPPLEAMQCGVPVLTSNTSSLPEVVGDAAMLVSPTDIEAIAHGMLELYRNSALRDSLSKSGLDRARQFSWQRCADKTIAAYGSAIAE